MVKKLVVKGWKLNAEIERNADAQKPAAALEAVRELLIIQQKIHSSWISITNTHYLAFQVAIMSRKTIKQAAEHIRMAYEINAEICPNPNSSDMIRCAREMKNPESAINYLSMERFY